MNLIDKMFCGTCGSEDCRIMICTNEASIDVDKDGTITFSEDSHANVGDKISDCYPNLNVEYVTGSCFGHEDETDSMTIYFKDGLIFKNIEDALKHLLGLYR